MGRDPNDQMPLLTYVVVERRTTYTILRYYGNTKCITNNTFIYDPLFLINLI